MLSIYYTTKVCKPPSNVEEVSFTLICHQIHPLISCLVHIIRLLISKYVVHILLLHTVFWFRLIDIINVRSITIIVFFIMYGILVDYNVRSSVTKKIAAIYLLSHQVGLTRQPFLFPWIPRIQFPTIPG